jgi:hypothetical protein
MLPHLTEFPFLSSQQRHTIRPCEGFQRCVFRFTFTWAIRINLPVDHPLPLHHMAA